MLGIVDYVLLTLGPNISEEKSARDNLAIVL